MTGHVTIRSVADAAGVSTTTVSNVINGHHEQMTPSTLLRIQAVMRQLGYRPNHVAQSLATNRTATIGLVISELTYSLNPLVIRGVESACHHAGYSLLLAANVLDLASERRALEVMRHKRVDGLVLFSGSFLNINNEHLYRLHEEGMPVAVINRYLPDDAPLARVYFDHFGGARQVIQHLIELGHSRVAHINGPTDRHSGRLRQDGYEAALTEAGIAIDPRLIIAGDYSFEDGHRLMHKLWQDADAVTSAKHVLAELQKSNCLARQAG